MMTASLRQTAVAGDADISDIPDELFEALPSSPLDVPAAASSAVDDELALLATLPALPSLLGLADRLASLQTQLDEARVEAEALREELRAKADLLRGVALALESI